MTNTEEHVDEPVTTSSPATLTALVREHQQRLIALAYRLLGNLEDARDEVQEAFLRFWQASGHASSGSSPLPLLMRIVINRCIDRLRRRKIVRFFTLSHEDAKLLQPAGESPAGNVQRKELEQVLMHAVDRLKPKQKVTFLLRDVQGYSVQETAALLQCSEGSVLTNLHLARKKLKILLAPYLADEVMS